MLNEARQPQPSSPVAWGQVSAVNTDGTVQVGLPGDEGSLRCMLVDGLTVASGDRVVLNRVAPTSWVAIGKLR